MTARANVFFTLLLSPHGVAMPKGLYYFTAVAFRSFFLLSFFRRLIS